MDGSGILIQPQLPNLLPHYEVWGVVLPKQDQRPWSVLIRDTAVLLKSLHWDHPRRLLHLCGESFGACLALQVLHHYPTLGDGLMVINSASALRHHSLLRSTIPLVHLFAPTLYLWATHALLPFLTNEERVLPEHRQLLLTTMQQVQPETVAWRLTLLDTLTLPPSFPHPLVIIAAAQDRLLPSLEESERLLAQYPQGRRVILPQSGHTCLLESGVNLISLAEALRG
jgi:pimeloyl-ACP methyl ester carboxylesterase